VHHTRTPRPGHELSRATGLFALGGGCALLLWRARPRQALLPSIHHAGGIAAALGHHDPVLTVVALARGVGLVLAGYLLVTSGLALVALLTRSRALSRVARAVTVPALRRLLPATLGFGLVLATTAAASPGATAGSPSPGSTGRAPTPTTTTAPAPRADLLTRLPEGSPDRSPTTEIAPTTPERASTPAPSPPPAQRQRAHSDDIARFHLDASPPAPSPTTTRSAPRPAPTPTHTRSSPPAPRSPAARRRTASPRHRPSLTHTGAPTWTVRPGDHLWGIAAATLRQRLGRVPTDAEVEPYWRRLIDLNRSRLVDPGNPDLIFPTQVFDLPR